MGVWGCGAPPEFVKKAENSGVEEMFKIRWLNKFRAKFCLVR